MSYITYIYTKMYILLVKLVNLVQNINITNAQ